MAIIKLVKDKIVVEDLELGLGSVTQDRGVGTQLNGNHIPYDAIMSLNQALDNKYDIGTMNGLLELKADLAGNSGQVFQASAPLSDNDVVTLLHLDNQLALKADLTYTDVQLELKSDITSILLKDGTSPAFTPVSPNQPCTKGYVDSLIVDVGAGDMLKSVYDIADTGAVDTTEGVGRTGTFLGISNMNQIMRLSQSEVTDCNTLDDMGMFIGEAVTNAPVLGTIGLEQVVYAGGKAQRCYAFNTQRRYDRVFNGTIWSGWVEQANTSDLLAKYDKAISPIDDNIVVFGSSETLVDSGQSINSLIPLPNGLSQSVMLDGTVSISNTVNTLTFDAILHTGNGTSKDIVSNINSVDLTVDDLTKCPAITSILYAGQTVYLDRATNQVKICTGETNAGTVMGEFTADWSLYNSISGQTPRGLSKVYIKDRDATYNHHITDGLRGCAKQVRTDATHAEQGITDLLTSFNIDGFTVGASLASNQDTHEYVSYSTLYTNIKGGTTNHGKFYIEAFNPKTNEGAVYYIGSGTTGNQLPNSMGVIINYSDIKVLSAVNDWVSGTNDGLGFLNSDVALSASPLLYQLQEDGHTTLTTDAHVNTLNSEYIMYYKAESETWTSGTYAGTGTGVNPILINGKARRIIAKSTSTGDWFVFDSERGQFRLRLNTSDVEISASYILTDDSFDLGGTSLMDTLGEEYYYEVYFDTNSNGGGSYDDLPSLNSNLQITDRKMIFPNGYGDNGAVNSMETNIGTETVAPTLIPSIVNYFKKTLGGVWEATADKPVFGEVSAISDYSMNGKWFNSSNVEYTTPITYIDGGVEVGADSKVVEYRESELDVPDISVESIEVNNLVVKDGFDLGQTGAVVTSERVTNLKFRNESKKPIDVSVTIQQVGTSNTTNVLVDGIKPVDSIRVPLDGSLIPITFTVPPSSTYEVVTNNTLISWYELS